jgi:hypothetical protein
MVKIDPSRDIGNDRTLPDELLEQSAGPTRSSTRIALCFPLLLSDAIGFEGANACDEPAFADVISGEGNRVEEKVFGEVKFGEGTWFGEVKLGDGA